MHLVFKIFGTLIIISFCFTLYYKYALGRDATPGSYTVASLMHSIPLLITPEDPVCSSDKKVLIVVHSFEGNFVRRDIIRQSYGAKEWREKFGFEILFVTGRSTNLLYNKWLRAEADSYGDILRGDFIENYRNMTVKALTWVRYAAKYCSPSSFVMHLDDDIVIDVFSIMQNFFGAQGEPDANTIYCFAEMNVKTGVRRDNQSEWYIPESVYPSKMYPTFCAGAAYVIPTAVLPSIIEKLERMTYMHVDDALITGIARNESGVDIKQVLPKFIFEKPPHLVLEGFRKKETMVAECGERCTTDVWKLLLAERRDLNNLVSLRTITPDEKQ